MSLSRALIHHQDMEESQHRRTARHRSPSPSGHDSPQLGRVRFVVYREKSAHHRLCVLVGGRCIEISGRTDE